MYGDNSQLDASFILWIHRLALTFLDSFSLKEHLNRYGRLFPWGKVLRWIDVDLNIQDEGRNIFYLEGSKNESTFYVNRLASDEKK